MIMVSQQQMLLQIQIQEQIQDQIQEQIQIKIQIRIQILILIKIKIQIQIQILKHSDDLNDNGFPATNALANTNTRTNTRPNTRTNTNTRKSINTNTKTKHSDDLNDNGFPAGMGRRDNKWVSWQMEKRGGQQPASHSHFQKYLSPSQNVFVLIAKCIFLIFKSICLDCKMYLS